MFKRLPLWTSVLFGGVSGALLINLTSAWTAYLFTIVTKPGGFYASKPPWQAVWGLWRGLWASVLDGYPYGIITALTITISGLVLGSAFTWGWLRHPEARRQVSQVCQRVGGSLFAALILYRIYVFIVLMNPHLVARIDRSLLLIASLAYALFDPALICSLGLWRWGVVLRKQTQNRESARGIESYD